MWNKEYLNFKKQTFYIYPINSFYVIFPQVESCNVGRCFISHFPDG